MAPYSPAGGHSPFFMAWAEEHLKPGDYAALFDDTDAEDEKKILVVQVSATCKKKLQRIKEATGKTLGEIVEECVMYPGGKNAEYRKVGRSERCNNFSNTL